MHPRPARGSLKGKKHERANRLIFTDGSTAVSTSMIINQYWFSSMDLEQNRNLTWMSWVG
jgi:hypothetical protein